MSTLDLREEIKTRKLDRMRLGQAVCEIVEIPSVPEVRVGVVPLTDAEAQMALDEAARVETADNIAGLMLRDHVQKVAQLAFAIRDPQDLSKRVYRTGKELQEDLDETDVNYIFDTYMELTENSNPAIEQIDPVEFEHLKKVLQEMDWNELSGRSWFAAKRFLGALNRDKLLPDSLLGSTSTTKSITQSD